jgi:hypothetical protein
MWQRVASRAAGLALCRWTHAPTNHEYLVQCEELLMCFWLNDVLEHRIFRHAAS